MKYIEELSAGDSFQYDNTIYLLTIDFKKNGNRLCFSMTDGSPKWFDSTAIVTQTNLYTLDTINNIIPLKETKNEYKIQN